MFMRLQRHPISNCKFCWFKHLHLTSVSHPACHRHVWLVACGLVVANMLKPGTLLLCSTTCVDRVLVILLSKSSKVVCLKLAIDSMHSFNNLTNLWLTTLQQRQACTIFHSIFVPKLAMCPEKTLMQIWIFILGWKLPLTMKQSRHKWFPQLLGVHIFTSLAASLVVTRLTQTTGVSKFKFLHDLTVELTVEGKTGKLSITQSL